MKRRLFLPLFAIIFGPLASLTMLFANFGIAHAAFPYNPSYLISDKIFTDYGSMDVSSIQTFLNSENSGIKNLTDTENCSPPTPVQPYSYSYYPHCGQVENAATLIYDAAQAYQISPRAILATLQKEQSLITNPNPTQAAINCAMGYNSCSGFVGFFSQVDNGTWQLREYLESMNGRTWWGTSTYPCASGHDVDSNNNLYSTGLYPGRTVTFYNPGGNARTVTLQTSATAALYCYTPYVGPLSDTGYSGSYNFVQYFEQWWGSVSSPCYNDTNITGAVSGQRAIATKLGINHTDNISLVQPNNTGTACLEEYTWQNSNYNAWYRLIASASPVVNPAASSIISADLDGDGIAQLYKVDYTGTGSGRIEVHGFTSDLQNYRSHVATISPSISHSDAEVVACDPAGYGRDDLFLVQYRNTTSGDVEIHEWAPGLQQWINHWDTHYSAVNPQNTQIICANLSPGSNKAAFYLIQYNGSGSGRLEIHGGITNLPYLTAWPYSTAVAWPVHSVTVSGPRIHWEGTTSSSADDADVIPADSNGDGIDELYIVQYHNTTSGRVEIYGLTPNFGSYFLLTTTNQAQY